MSKLSQPLAASLALAIICACAHQSAANETTTQPQAPLATVTERNFPIVLDENGTVGPPAGASTQLAFPASGVIRAILVHAGEHVSAGQPLASLDLRSFQIAAQGARADERAADASAQAAAVDRYSTRLSVDRAAVARAARLYAAGVVALKDVDDARATLAADEADARAAAASRVAALAQAESAAAKAQAAQTDLSRATLRSPIDGIVVGVMHRAGEPVDTTTAVLSVAPLQQQQITLRVPSNDAARIAVGDPAQIRVTGMPGSTSGHVVAVVQAVDPSTQTATVVVDGVPAGAGAGSAVRARITVAVAHGMVIPQAAIVQDPQSGDDVVFAQQKQKDGTLGFAARTVTVKSENGTDALITSGVKPGERIAAAGAFELLAPAGGGD